MDAASGDCENVLTFSDMWQHLFFLYSLKNAFSVVHEMINNSPLREAVVCNDVLDALAVAVTAVGGLKGLVSIPKDPGFD